MGTCTSHESISAGPAVGIDLGSTFSCVGVSRHGKVDIIANSQGYRKMPSCVAFRGEEHLVGVAAKNQAAMNPMNTVYDVKRLIGRRFDDEAVQSDMKRWPFKVINWSGKPKVEVKCYGKTKQFTAEEITSMVLLEMKRTAEAYLGEKVTNAVVTVPAYFNDSQRKATINAGEIAGLNVMRIINESTAAGLAYGLGKGIDRPHNALIFDLGGGTLDVSIMCIGNKQFEVKAVGGDTHLGGDDFDSRLVDHCVETFKQEHGGIDLTANTKAIGRLRKACESAKRTLSLLECTSIEVDSLYGDIDFSTPISRCQFEQLCSDLFERILTIVKQVLSDAELDKADIHEILLVGGSTRILKVQHLLQDYFSGSRLNKSINADEAAACGAALLASSMSDEQSPMIMEVAPLSVNLEASGGVIKTLIERNMKIPLKKTLLCATSSDNQRDMLLRVYEGGHEVTNGNTLAGEFRLLAIPPLPRGFTRIEVTFAIDENGLLNVSAVIMSSRKRKHIHVEELGHLSKRKIKQVMNESEELEQKNEKQRSKMTARNVLENYIFTIQSEMEKDEVRQEIPEKSRKKILMTCEKTLKRIEVDEKATKKDYKLMLKKVKSVCRPVVVVKKQDSLAQKSQMQDDKSTN
ncbi:Heat shock cognate 70 kDa protein [Taenia solium]|eukprot:TsM_000875700 transcript=TsM_000875700 gene=TsM_000875700